jgi:hypothetical protein
MANITIDRSSDTSITFQYYEDDETTERTLVGATVYFTVKPAPFDSDTDDSESTIQKSITSHTNAAAGLTTITLSDSDTNVDPKNYFYDIKVKESDGNIYTATSGRCRVSGTPTNRSN